MKKFLLKTSLAIATLLASFTASAHDFVVDGIYYNAGTTTAWVTFSGANSGTVDDEYSGIVTIPETVTYNGSTYNVTDIEVEAFKDCDNVTEITIPKSISKIGYNAFSGCSNLNTVNFNATNCHTMGYEYGSTFYPVFWNCPNLTTLNIGDNVTRIPNCAFYGCSGIKEVTIPEAVTEIGFYSFANCSDLYTVNFNAQKCISGGYVHYYYVFAKCASLSTLNVGENVTRIPQYLFQDCSALSTINFSNSLSIIEPYAFSGCAGLTSVIIPETTTYIGGGAFKNCTGLTSFNIPANLTNCESSVLYGCSGLTEIIVDPNNTKYCSVDGIMYSNDKTILYKYPASREGNEYTILDSVTHISHGAFENCKYLTTIIIPDNVTYIGDEAFANCEIITNFNIPSSVTEVGMNAFTNSGWYNNQADGVLYLDNWCLGYKGELLGAISINDGTRGIADGAFYNLTGLTGISIPNSVLSIGYSALSRTSITNITIPNSVTSIGSGAFSGCTQLTNATLSNSISEISNSLFYRTSIESISIPNAVTTIGEFAFQASKIKSIDIPNSVTEINQYAFSFCDSLTTVNFGSSVDTIGYFAFGGNPQFTSFNVDTNNTSFSSIDGVLFNKSQTKIIQYPKALKSEHYYIPNSVTEVASEAFYECDSISSITIPKSVEKIGYAAFNFMNGVETVTSLNPNPPYCESNFTFSIMGTATQLKVPVGSADAYSTATGWNYFYDIVEIPIVEVFTQESNATFEIPTTEGAVTYTVNVYSNEAMTQLVATTNYDAAGNIIPMSTSLELSIDGFENGIYYYDVIAKSESGETLNTYTGSFEISTSGIGSVGTDDNATEVARYDIHGRLLKEPTPGINIVKLSNGTTRKEMVK